MSHIAFSWGATYLPSHEVSSSCSPSCWRIRQISIRLRLANYNSSSLAPVLGSKTSMWPTLANQNLPCGYQERVSLFLWNCKQWTSFVASKRKLFAVDKRKVNSKEKQSTRSENYSFDIIWDLDQVISKLSISPGLFTYGSSKFHVPFFFPFVFFLLNRVRIECLSVCQLEWRVLGPNFNEPSEGYACCFLF